MGQQNYLKSSNVGELIEVIKYCRKHRIQLLLLEEVQIYYFQIKVLKELLFPFEDMNQYHVNGSEVTAQCGVTMIKLCL